MSRCVCNAIMTLGEMARNKPDGTPEELCTKCLVATGLYEFQELEVDRTLPIDWKDVGCSPKVVK